MEQAIQVLRFARRYSLLVLLFVMLLLIFTLNTSYAQEAAPCPAEFGCAAVSLPTDTMVGDFFVGEALLAAGQNSAVLQLTPSQANQIVVRNIVDTGDPNFNLLFIYPEVSVTANVAAGQTRSFKVTLQKQFIRGTLSHTCDPRSRQEGENVVCQILVDGVNRAETTPGDAVEVVLDGGSHLVGVQLVGEHAPLWEPTYKEQTVNITNGRTATARTQFDKKAHLILALNQTGVVADFYVNGELVAAQVASYEKWVEANVNFAIEAKNITDPAAGADYRWQEASASARLNPGQERTVTLNLRQEFLRGTLAVVCNPNGRNPSDNVTCQVSVDGAIQGQVAPGETWQATFEKGEHAIHVDLIGEHNRFWSSTVFDQITTITAGRTSTIRAQFAHKPTPRLTMNWDAQYADFGPEFRPRDGDTIPQNTVCQFQSGTTIEFTSMICRCPPTVEPQFNGVCGY